MAVCCFPSGARSWNHVRFQLSSALRGTSTLACYPEERRSSLLQDAVHLAEGSAYPGGGEESRRLIKHPWAFEARLGCYHGAHARGAEQAMPPGQTLDWVGRLEERERPGCGCAHQCRTRSLSARSAHPPLSRVASPAPLARRNVGMDMQPSVCMARRSVCFQGEEQGLTLYSFFLTFHARDCC
jgi:hypothetical protein